MTRFLGRGLLEELGVDVLVADAHAFLAGQAGLDPVVDDALERARHQILALLIDELGLQLGLARGQLPGGDLRADAAPGDLEAPALDLGSLAELVLGDRLAVDAPDRRQVVVVVD